uniref:TerD domain-containing protein n=1 Tax=Alexandrium catenella TaxID=2925 RepID=A0A7S1RZM6_ALECA
MVRQLSDPTSFLLTRAKLKGSFGDASYTHAEALGDRVSDPSLHSGLHKALGVKGTVDEVIGFGTDDEGVLAICCPEGQVKKLKKPFAMHAAKACQDLGAIVEAVQTGPEQLSMEFSIEVVNDSRLDAGGLLKKVNSEPFRSAMERGLSSAGLPDAEVTVRTKATSRELARLEFLLRWDFPASGGGAGGLPDYLDGICLVYREDDPVHTVDFRSAHASAGRRREATREASQRCQAIGRAIRHSGDVMSDTGGEHRMSLDLAALPTDVTDLYFVLAGYDCRDLSQFPNPAVEIVDAHSQKSMMRYSLASAGSAEAVIMCSLSRAESRKWIVRGLGIPTAGSVRDYAPIKAAIAKLQVGYGHWERRGDLVELKVLHKLGRVTRAGTSEFAGFVQALMALPVPVFQLVAFFV